MGQAGDSILGVIPDFHLLDLAALIWFAGAWAGYTWFADTSRWRRHTIMARIHELRHEWMRNVLWREQRILDANLVANLMQSVSFFASTSIFIVAGLITVLGAGEQAMVLIAEMPFAAAPTRGVFQIKVVLLGIVFVYAFFKFTWSLRLFNYTSILIGALPKAEDAEESDIEQAGRVALVASRAGDHFNRGLRAYYFAFAGLSWFLQPWLLILASSWVVVVLYRREFRSHTLRALGPAAP